MNTKQVTGIKRAGPRLKPFFWNKLNAIDSKSIWNELGPVPFAVDDELGDLVEVFRMDIKDNKPVVKSSNDAKRSVINSRQVTSLLDITRANNVGG
jgi:hypothetical protein